MRIKAYDTNSLGNILDSSVKKAGIVSAKIMREFFPSASIYDLRFLRIPSLRSDLAIKIREIRSNK